MQPQVSYRNAVERMAMMKDALLFDASTASTVLAVLFNVAKEKALDDILAWGK